MSETYSFKSYLTWSTFHLFYLPIIIILNKARDFYNTSNADCANDVLSLEQNYYYYLQVQNRSNVDGIRNTLKDERLCRIQTGHLRDFPGGLIHGGGFKTSRSGGNFRIQLIPYLKNHGKGLCSFVKSNRCSQFSYVPDAYLKVIINLMQKKIILLLFVITSLTIKLVLMQSRSNNDDLSFNPQRSDVVQSNAYNSSISLENNNIFMNPRYNIQYSLHLPKCNRNPLFQSVDFSSTVKTPNTCWALSSVIDDKVKTSRKVAKLDVVFKDHNLRNRMTPIINGDRFHPFSTKKS